ncbi:PHA/PHB synthase family protein [Alterisphingorhabdus coralli]|uniref:Alpha/beta fold hydrolase n=1 Tax=Alterisphingorhabdus coralli TaxID=3071408 RepID=A0AA97F6Q6_9SPHN|nr:alpha/beta fold hydrolase [Parasphingorhabdus sp. SCSIO 66989]WOE74288.1 alpha/beta fold hydrolase [Parasphingorhabdus sp. SCSIO 66989]
MSGSDGSLVRNKEGRADNGPEPDLQPAGETAYPIDRILQANLSKFTGGVSPITMSMAFFDWAGHLALSPSKLMEFQQEAAKSAIARSVALRESGADQEKERHKSKDRRFKDPAWQKWPYSFYAESFLRASEELENATQDIRGVSEHHENIVNFMGRQMLDLFSPANYPWSNPKVVNKAIESRGQNFIQGTQNFIADYIQLFSDQTGLPKEDFQVGQSVACTPGKVIFRNRLIELIQYAPQSDTVQAEPILIVPAWIMKYYILDLSPHNSLVDYLVKQGHTVFIISWKNPGADDRDLAFEDYLNLGVLEAVKAVQAIVPDQKINAAGYCLGGTLLMMAAAYLERQQNSAFNTLSLFAAQADFEEAGELMLFVDDSQLAFLEDVMWTQGYLDKSQMAGAFSLLRSNDLIWSKMVNEYLLGKRDQPNDLMAWNADATRMPYKMHSEYLHSLYLNNDLSEGRFKVNGQTITLTDTEQDIFAVGTVKDHVAPWQSVYKLHLYTDTQVTFVLTTGGHNAGIISEPGRKNRSYQVAVHNPESTYLAPEKWQEQSPSKQGSWWPEWMDWLQARSQKPKTKPPEIGDGRDYRVLCDAPGTYVFES